MFRVYYLVNSMDQVKTALKNVEQSDLGSNRVHVMARDNGELSREGIHATTPWEDTNIMTTGFYGAMVGAVIGVVIMSLAQFYLKDLMEVAAHATASVPVLPDLLNPDRWLLWLGVLFILLVYFFPAGIAGTLMKKGGH